MFEVARTHRAVMTTCLDFHPWNSFLLVSMDSASWEKFLRGMALFVFFRPGRKNHSFSSDWYCRYPCFGIFLKAGRTMVVFEPCLIQGICGKGSDVLYDEGSSSELDSSILEPRISWMSPESSS